MAEKALGDNPEESFSIPRLWHATCSTNRQEEREKQVARSPIERGQRFRFRLRDVICPEKEQTVTQITPELEVTGRIVFLSDSGEEIDKFAVLEVTGLHSPLVVPVNRLVPSADEEEIREYNDLHTAGRAG